MNGWIQKRDLTAQFNFLCSACRKLKTKLQDRVSEMFLMYLSLCC